jgi:hypothetical protein
MGDQFLDIRTALNGLNPILFGYCLVKTKNPARGGVVVENTGFEPVTFPHAVRDALASG